MRNAGLGHRLGAGLVSLLLFIPCLIAVDLAAEMALADASDLFARGAGGVPSDGPHAAAAFLQAVFQLSLLVPITAIVYGMLGLFFGKTPGQAIVKMSILGMDENRAGFRQRLRRYLVTYGWALIMFIGMLSAFLIEDSGMAREGDFLVSALLGLGFVSVLWLAVLMLDPLVRALGDKEVFLVDKVSETLPYVKQSKAS